MDEHQIKSSEILSQRTIRRLGLGTFGILVACAVAGLALLLSWPAAAQTPICDTDFLTGNWQLKVFSCPAGNNVTASQQAAPGTFPTTPPLPSAACVLNLRTAT